MKNKKEIKTYVENIIEQWAQDVYEFSECDSRGGSDHRDNLDYKKLFMSQKKLELSKFLDSLKWD